MDFSYRKIIGFVSFSTKGVFLHAYINKHGNPRVRHQLVEAVWRLERWQPGYPPLRKLREAKGTRTRKRAAVAVEAAPAMGCLKVTYARITRRQVGGE